jgi:hypothetical protein
MVPVVVQVLVLAVVAVVQVVALANVPVVVLALHCGARGRQLSWQFSCLCRD